MKKLSKILLGLLLIASITFGCDSLLDVDSDRLIFTHENQLNSPNDTIYSMVGIFTQLEKLSERYILLGELRGDLMDISENASPYLEEINNFDISPDNPYNRPEDYYAVINHCNYLIQTIDTTIVANAEKVMYKEFAAAKVFRAWTYMQLVLNYRTVKYYENPILSVQDADEYLEYSIDELIPALIQDLEPWKTIDNPGGISLGPDIYSDKLFIPIRFMLGDLYLWNSEYEKAAIEYHALIEDNNYAVRSFYQSKWTVDNSVFVSREEEDQLWPNIFTMNNPEQITMIAGSTELGEGANLDSISFYQDIIPSQAAIDIWDKQTYYNNASVLTQGDLRGDIGSYLSPDEETSIFDTYIPDNRTLNYITKFTWMSSEYSKAIAIYRVSLLYLRYAEAVNRAGKPNLAFAVLKSGMSTNTLKIDTIVPRHEKYIEYTDTTGTFYDFVNFEDLAFNNNLGVHALGCYNVKVAKDYIIPTFATLADSIDFVEDKIIEELALETAFEGNRFHDLMRVAMRRGNDFLADLVSEKYTDKEAIQGKLIIEDNWYLK